MAQKTTEKDPIMVQLEDVKTLLKGLQENKIDYSKIDTLYDKMEQNNTTSTEQIELLKKTIAEANKPKIKENKYTLDITSKSGFLLFAGLFAAVILLAVTTNKALMPDYDQRDNDLKYRYIRMKGEASPNVIADLEDLFEYNRDNNRIDKMQESVEGFEEAVEAKAHLDEQNRLRAIEAKKLDDKANDLKKQ
ncbi:MAG: hypothetical protein SNI70_07645 [Rikenellaceae bacterium]